MLFSCHGSHNLEKVLNFSTRLEMSLNSFEVLEKYLISLLPYLPVYKSIPCISRPPIFGGKKSNFLISLLNVHGILILHSSISGTVDSQKIKGRKHLIVLWFSGCYMCRHFVLEFRKSSQKIDTCKPQTNLFRCSRIKGFRG